MVKRDIPLKRFTVAVLLFLTVICLSCSSAQPPTSTTPASVPFPTFTTKIGLGYYQGISLEEASLSSEGVSIVPAYLPDDLKIQEVYIYYHPEEDRAEVKFIISDEKVEKKLVTNADMEGIIRPYYELECKMKMTVRQAGPHIRMGEKVKVNYGTGRIMVGDETQSLYWYVGRIEFILTVGKDVPTEELIKVAESVKPVSVT